MKNTRFHQQKIGQRKRAPIVQRPSAGPKGIAIIPAQQNLAVLPGVAQLMKKNNHDELSIEEPDKNNLSGNSNYKNKTANNISVSFEKKWIEDRKLVEKEHQPIIDSIVDAGAEIQQAYRPEEVDGNKPTRPINKDSKQHLTYRRDIKKPSMTKQQRWRKTLRSKSNFLVLPLLFHYGPRSIYHGRRKPDIKPKSN